MPRSMWTGAEITCCWATGKLCEQAQRYHDGGGCNSRSGCARFLALSGSYCQGLQQGGLRWIGCFQANPKDLDAGCYCIAICNDGSTSGCAGC